MMDIIFMDIGLIIIVATILAFVARALKQPLIPAYVLAGIILIWCLMMKLIWRRDQKDLVI